MTFKEEFNSSRALTIRMNKLIKRGWEICGAYVKGTYAHLYSKEYDEYITLVCKA